MKWKWSYWGEIFLLFIGVGLFASVPTWYAVDKKLHSVIEMMRTYSDTAMFVQNEQKKLADLTTSTFARGEGLLKSMYSEASMSMVREEKLVEAVRKEISRLSANVQDQTDRLKNLEEDVLVVDAIRSKRTLRAIQDLKDPKR